jgi:cytoskeletal protein CcmA (bactofilin family)
VRKLVVPNGAKIVDSAVGLSRVAQEWAAGRAPMSAAIDTMPEANKLYIGKGVTIKAAVLVSNTVVIAGYLEGDVSVENLIVSETGTIRGRISVARNAEIAGKVFERLDVKGLLILRSSSRVDGNISFGTLTMEQGASVTGEVSSAHSRADQRSSTSDRNQSARFGNSAPANQPDLSALELMPGPVTAPV